MQANNRVLTSNRKRKLLCFYMVALLFIAVFSSFCISDAPNIVINTAFATENGGYTSNTSINISVTVDADNSSFINWNSSLVGFWGFEYFNSTNITDGSGYNHNIEWADYISIQSDNITNGKYGQGFIFDGSEERYLKINDTSDLDITDEITVEVWFKEFETTFNKTYGEKDGTNHHDWGYCTQQTTDGGYIITGEYNYEDEDSNSDLILIKTDSNGIVEWTRIEGGGNFDSGQQVQQTSDGGYIVVGYTRSFGNSHTYDGDLWLYKTDSEGNEEMNLTFGGEYDEMGRSLQETNDGGYIITGYNNSYDNNNSRRNLWLLKTDYEGNEEWNKIYGGSSDDEGYHVEQTNDSGYIITGLTSSFGSGSGDLWLIKTNSTGDNDGLDPNNSTWNKTFGGSGYDIGYSVNQTSDEGFIVTGYIKSFDALERDLWLLKTSYSGDEEINRTYGGVYDDRGRSVKQTTDGGYIITGQKEVDALGNSNIWIIKTDTIGSKPDNPNTGNETTFNYTIGVDKFGRGRSIQQTTDGGYILAGTGNFSNNAGADNDILLIKINASGVINTNYNNNQTRTKTLVGKNISAYEIELKNGTISGYIDGNSISSEQNLYNLTQWWHHVVLTYNNTCEELKLYINGTLEQTTSPVTFDTTNAFDLTVGRNFSGLIDEVRIWNRCLSEDEITASYSCPGSYYQTFNDLSEGEYAYTIYAISPDGDNSTTTITYTIDNTNPTVSITNPDDNGFNNSLTAINGTCSDTSSGISEVNLTIYNLTGDTYWDWDILSWSTWDHYTSWIDTNLSTDYSTWSNTTDTITWFNGSTYYINATPIDNASNIGSKDSNSFLFDTEKPYSSVNTISSSITTSPTTITAYSDDNGSGLADVSLYYYYSSDGSSGSWSTANNFGNGTDPWTTVSWSFNFPSGNGHYRFYSIAYDNASNNESAPIENDTYCQYQAATPTPPGGSGPSTPPNDDEEDDNTTEDADGNETVDGNETNDNTTSPGGSSVQAENETKTPGNITEGINIEENFTKTIIIKLGVTPSRNLSNTNITIFDNLTIPPENLTENISESHINNDTVNYTIDNFSIYRYIDIEISSNESYVDENDLDSVVIYFKINRSWINENGYNKSNVYLFRYHNNRWNKLTIECYDDTNETYYFYKAEFSGLSTFAVVGGKVIENEGKQKDTDDKPGLPWIIIIGFIIAAIIVLVIILFKTGYIYIEEKNIEE